LEKAKKTNADSRQQSLATIEALFADAIARVKAEAAQAIAEQRANSETQAQQRIADIEAEYQQKLAKVNSDAEAKAKNYEEEMVRIKAETQERAKALTEQIAKPKAENAENQTAIPITESKKSAQSPPDFPGKRPVAALAIYAKDIMQKEMVWGNPEGSVQEVISKMEQHNIRYLLIGCDGVLEGIVSKSDLAEALSPYLRPEFAKWRRPLDDATLKLKSKWIMSRPVHIIGPQTLLAVIMSSMCRFRVRTLPVVDQQGKVLGVVTEADVFDVLLMPKSSIPTGQDHKKPTSDNTPIESTSTIELTLTTI